MKSNNRQWGHAKVRQWQKSGDQQCPCCQERRWTNPEAPQVQWMLQSRKRQAKEAFVQEHVEQTRDTISSFAHIQQRLMEHNIWMSDEIRHTVSQQLLVSDSSHLSKQLAFCCYKQTPIFMLHMINIVPNSEDPICSQSLSPWEKSVVLPSLLFHFLFRQFIFPISAHSFLYVGVILCLSFNIKKYYYL